MTLRESAGGKDKSLPLGPGDDLQRLGVARCSLLIAIAVLACACSADVRDIADEASRALRGRPVHLAYQGLRIGTPQDSARRMMGSQLFCTERGCSSTPLNRSAGVREMNAAIFEKGVVTSWWADRVLEATWQVDSVRSVFVDRWGKPLDVAPVPIDCIDLFEHPHAVPIGHWRNDREETYVFVMTPEDSVSGAAGNYPVLRIALGQRGVTHCWGGGDSSQLGRIRP